MRASCVSSRAATAPCSSSSFGRRLANPTAPLVHLPRRTLATPCAASSLNAVGFIATAMQEAEVGAQFHESAPCLAPPVCPAPGHPCIAARNCWCVAVDWPPPSPNPQSPTLRRPPASPLPRCACRLVLTSGQQTSLTPPPLRPPASSPASCARAGCPGARAISAVARAAPRVRITEFNMLSRCPFRPASRLSPPGNRFFNRDASRIAD